LTANWILRNNNKDIFYDDYLMKIMGEIFAQDYEFFQHLTLTFRILRMSEQREKKPTNA
jgi:hypothetical protein